MSRWCRRSSLSWRRSSSSSTSRSMSSTAGSTRVFGSVRGRVPMDQQGVVDLHGFPYQHMRERPLPLRWLSALGSFFVKKPLGGLGLVLIAFMLFIAAAGPLIDRYPPDEVFTVPNPAYDPVIAEKVKSDPFLRLQYPP